MLFDKLRICNINVLEKSAKKGKLKKLPGIQAKTEENILKGIEMENYELIPGEAFIKGYIRMYAEAMGLSSNILLKLYKKHACQTP